MVLIKALVTGLTGVSLCMADISGIVTDTGTTPVPGAFVQLEKGGQTATTGPDGRFTLAASAAILPCNANLLPNGLSARISGNVMVVTIAEQAAVQVETFDLNGKSLSSVRKTLDAGSNSIALPYRGTGIYLSKVKSGNREFVLKSNSVGMAAPGSLIYSHGPPANYLTKQSSAVVKTMAGQQSADAINDVIAVTKAGYLNYRCVQFNDDTAGVLIKMIASTGTVTDKDGNVYQTVKIGNQVWMAENLRVTKYNDGTPLPLDTATATWAGAITPKYCFYNNTTASDSIRKYGALYNWYVAGPANSRKIAPAGWHVSTETDWDTLQNYLIANGYNWDGSTGGNKIAKSLAAKTDWVTSSFAGGIGYDLTKNNRSGFSALGGGFRSSVGDFDGQCKGGFWWSAAEADSSSAWGRSLRDIGFDCGFLYRNRNNKSCGSSVRLVRTDN